MRSRRSYAGQFEFVCTGERKHTFEVVAAGYEPSVQCPIPRTGRWLWRAAPIEDPDDWPRSADPWTHEIRKKESILYCYHFLRRLPPVRGG